MYWRSIVRKCGCCSSIRASSHDGQIYLRGLVLETFYQRGFLFKLITDGVCYDVDAAIVAGGKACTAIDNCGNKDPAIGNCGTQPKPPVRTAGQAE